MNLSPHLLAIVGMSMFDSAFFMRLVLMTLLCLGGCKAKVNEPVYFPHQASDLTPEALVQYGRLENGLRFAVMHNATPSNTASLLMRIDTGSLNETEETRGLAHFLEHMAFNGSENIPEGEMIKRLEKYGLAFGADTNASTSFDETIYQLELPEANEDILNEGLFIMRETASKLTLDSEAIEKERGVILAEKRARSSPAYNASIAQLSYYFRDTIIPDRLPIGTEDTINKVTPEQFRAFYEGYYRPENAFIVLVGDFETDFAAEKIAEYFEDWSASGEALASREVGTQGSRGTEAVYYTDPEIQTSIALNVMSKPDLRPDNLKNRRDFYIESLGNRILSRRLAALAQTTDAAFISGGAGTSTAYDNVKISSVSMSAQPEQWAEALATAEQELRKAYKYGFTEAELNEQLANTRQSLKVSVERMETRRTPSLARQILGSFSGDNVMTNPAYNLERFESYADKITPEAVHKAFKLNWEGYENPQIYLSTPAFIEDAETTILSALQASQAVDVTANIATDAGVFAYTEFGKPGQVKSRQTVEDIDFEQVVFENGVRLNMKKTPYQKGVMSIQVAYGQGELFLPQDNLGLRWLSSNALSLGGLAAHSADDIRTLMAGKSVGAGFDMGTKQLFMSGSTTPDDLPEQMNLMLAYYKAPGYRPEAEARYDKFISSYYPTLDSTPGGVAARDVERLIRSGNPRFGVPAEEDLQRASLSDFKAWMDEAVPDRLIEIGVVGDIDPEIVIREVARTFGTLPPVAAAIIEPSEMMTKLSFPKGQTRPTILTHAGESGTSLLRVYWPAPDGRDDMIVRRINVLSSMFKIRLTDELREDLGATYSPSAYSSLPRIYPDYGYMAASIEVSPEDIDKAEARIHALAESFSNGNIDQDLFERAIRPIRESIEETLESNGYWMGIIAQSQTDVERLERHRRRHNAYQNMTLDDVKAVAKQVFQRKNAVSYHILPQE